MRSKLAIVGTATRTRDLVPYEDEDLDVWVFNEAAQKDWVKRADAVFQLHDVSIWKNPMNRGDAEHGAWLMSGNTPTIYMLEQYPEVPKSVRLPIQEMVDELLQKLEVDSERARKEFFTSTIAYAFALAIYLGYKEIHTYGVELADETEYKEQYPCAMFWNGIALGRGIKWVSHSSMFDVPQYPMETFVGLPMSVFEDKVNELKPMIEELRKVYTNQKALTEIAVRRFEEVGTGKEEMIDAIKQLAVVGQKFGIPDGACQENERYLTRASAMQKHTGTYVFSRHEFKRDQAAIGVRRQDVFDQQLTPISERLYKLIEDIEPRGFGAQRRQQFKDLRRMIEEYVKANVIIAMYAGAINEDARFIELIEKARAEKFAASYKKVPQEVAA